MAIRLILTFLPNLKIRFLVMQAFIYILLSTTIVILLLAFTLFLVGVRIYNSLIMKKNQVDKAFSSVDVLLKKRWDLIPNLVAVVKKYLEFEQQTLAEITRLRSRVMLDEISSQQRFNLENQITRTMGNILASSENYPQLKSNHHLNHLIASLNEIEEQISAARRFYNTAVTNYNNAIEMFPNNLVASYLKYRHKELFIIPAEERDNLDLGK